jgi:hypothetical protein
MQTDAISRSAVLEALESEKGRVMAEKWNDWPFTGEILARAVDTARAFIKDIPAIDAVPVVRCYECKYRCTQTCPMYHTEISLDDLDGYDTYDTDRTDDDGFCHLGARMDGEEHAAD